MINLHNWFTKLMQAFTFNVSFNSYGSPIWSPLGYGSQNNGLSQADLDAALQKALAGSAYGYGKMNGDPFGTAMSGNQSGTLQPFVNKMTNQASNALYGGLQSYQPQPMQSGNAGGQTIQTEVPQFSMPPAMQSMMQGQDGGGFGFGKRAWMKE
jgi:hypothetical protein